MKQFTESWQVMKWTVTYQIPGQLTNLQINISGSILFTWRHTWRRHNLSQKSKLGMSKSNKKLSYTSYSHHVGTLEVNLYHNIASEHSHTCRLDICHARHLLSPHTSFLPFAAGKMTDEWSRIGDTCRVNPVNSNNRCIQI